MQKLFVKSVSECLWSCYSKFTVSISKVVKPNGRLLQNVGVCCTLIYKIDYFIGDYSTVTSVSA